MLVSNLQQFLLLLLPPLRTVGLSAGADKSLTASLESMAQALGPFQELSIDQLTELLRVAREYRATGALPDWILNKQPTAKKPRKPPATSAPKPPKLTVEEAIAKLKDLQSRSHEFEPDWISQEVKNLERINGA